MIEIVFFSTKKTNEVKKKLMGMLFSKTIINYRRSERQKQYKLEEKKIVSELGYSYYIICEENNKQKTISWIKKEFGDILHFTIK